MANVIASATQEGYSFGDAYESAFLPGDGAPPELRSLGDKAPATSGVISLSLK
jgi:hypothetical protein